MVAIPYLNASSHPGVITFFLIIYNFSISLFIILLITRNSLTQLNNELIDLAYNLSYYI